MRKYIVVPARPEHIPHLRAVEIAAATMFPDGFLPAELVSDSVPTAVLKQAQRENRLWAALHGAEATPVGFALMTYESGLAMLAELDVLPEHGRNGVGRELVAQVVRRAAESGDAFLYLTTFSNIAWNRPFYQRLGFEVVTGEELHPALAAILAKEKARGLENRVAMRLAVQSGGVDASENS